MSKQTVNLGSAANDGTGDTARNAFGKVNSNFDEVYDRLADVETDLETVTYDELLGKPTLGTAAFRNVGTEPTNLVEVLTDNKLPALDGSNLTNISGGGGGGSITIDGIPVSGQFAMWTASNHLEGHDLVAADITDLESATGIPTGGSDGQVLTKLSGTNYDTAWETPTSVLPDGGTTGQALVKLSSTDGDADWATISGGGGGSGDVTGPATTVAGRAALWADTTGNLLTQSAAVAILEGDARLSNSRAPTTHTHPFADLTGVATAAQGAKADTAVQSTTLVSTMTTLAGSNALPENDWRIPAIDPGTPDAMKMVVLTSSSFAALVQIGMQARSLENRVIHLEAMSALHKDTGFSAAGQVVTSTGTTRDVQGVTPDDVTADVADIMTANPGFVPDCEIQADAFAETTLVITSGALDFDAAAVTLNLVGTAITAENITIDKDIWDNMLPGVPYTLYIKQPSSAVTVTWGTLDGGLVYKHYGSLASYQINDALLGWVLKKITIGATTYCTTSYFGDVS